MNLKIAMGLFVLLSMFAAAEISVAQDAKKETHDKTRTITGCLQKGDDANEFHLVAKDGKWDIKSDNVKLADHVGHTVQVVGVVESASAHGMKEDVKTAVDKDAKETGDLTVTNLTMVSDSCK